MNKTAKSAKASRIADLYQASDFVLAWENQDDFLEMYRGLREDFTPDGTTQELVVVEIARLFWTKRRLNVGHQKAYYQKIDPSLLAKAEAKGPEAVRKLVDGIAAQQLEIGDKSRAMLKQQMDLSIETNEQMLQEIEDARKENKTIAPEREAHLVDLKKIHEDAINLTIIPLLKDLALMEPEFEKQTRPELIERNAKRNAEIDRQIDKQVQRMVQLKEYRRFYDQGGINGPAIDVTPTRMPAKPKDTGSS